MMKKVTLYALLISTTLLVGMCIGASSQKDIVDTAVAAGNFTTLVSAVQAAGLVDTLKSVGPFTVFAPTDAAFAKVPKVVLAALMANKTLLTAVLTYHVVPGEVMSSDLKDGMSVKTVQGSNVKVTINSSGVMVNNARVIKPDIKASNGVIHVVDAVILPPAVIKATEAIGTVAAAAGKAKAEAAAKKSTPGFESIYAIAGLLSMAFVAYRRHD
jgi:uncharacterized surface protein with fasciclin (FAS1) repeats